MPKGNARPGRHRAGGAPGDRRRLPVPPVLLRRGGRQAPPAQQAVDLRIGIEPRTAAVEYAGWDGAAGPGWRDPGDGSEVRFSLAAGEYFLLVGLYDSTRAEHRDDRLTVSLNGRDLGTFQRGKADGWSVWQTKAAAGAFRPAGAQVLGATRTFSFFKVGPFAGKPPPAKCGYVDSGRRCAEYVMQKWLAGWKGDEGDKRAVSVERPVLGPLRVMAPCMAMGEAAGVAAALAVRGKKAFADVDPAALRTELKRHGAVVDWP